MIQNHQKFNLFEEVDKDIEELQLQREKYPKFVEDELKKALKFIPTGSKVIYPKGGYNDIDILLLFKDLTEQTEILKNKNWEVSSHHYVDTLVTARKGLYNFILTNDLVYFESWVKATLLAKALELDTKEKRKICFKVICGN